MPPHGAGLTWSCALLTVAAVVSGKPHHRGCPGAAPPLHDDYARSLLALQQYYPEAQPPAVAEPQPSPEYARAPCTRSGRSNGGGPPSDGLVAVVPNHAVEQATAPPSVVAAVKSAAPLGPCKGPSPPQQHGQAAANETAAAVVAVAPVDKLTAYYDRLKAQQEQLARHQLEQQLLEQQRQRHRDYALVQQQIQQQYYQQQQHSLLMLDQLHKNPTFVSQLAAYMEQRLKANNGTAAVAAAEVPAAPAVAEETKIAGGDEEADDRHFGGSGGGRSAEEKDQDITKHVHDKDDEEGCGLLAKRVEPRQAAAIRDRPCEFTDDVDGQDRDRSEDDPVVEKIYSMIKK